MIEGHRHTEDACLAHWPVSNAESHYTLNKTAPDIPTGCSSVKERLYLNLHLAPILILHNAAPVIARGASLQGVGPRPAVAEAWALTAARS
jgi:hypothetical protein